MQIGGVAVGKGAQEFHGFNSPADIVALGPEVEGLLPAFILHGRNQITAWQRGRLLDPGAIFFKGIVFAGDVGQGIHQDLEGQDVFGIDLMGLDGAGFGPFIERFVAVKLGLDEVKPCQPQLGLNPAGKIFFQGLRNREHLIDIFAVPMVVPEGGEFLPAGVIRRQRRLHVPFPGGHERGCHQ